MIFIISFFTLAGVNFSLWMCIGIIRWFYEKLRPSRRNREKPYKRITTSQVCVIIPAHNEELTIGETVGALLRSLRKENIYVVSDKSTDRTASVARLLGVNVYSLRRNVGKARAIVATLKRYKLIERYKAVLINDADVVIDEHYMKRALPLFSDPQVSVVAPHGVTHWRNRGIWATYFLAYRVRLWRVIQLGMRFGQTWKFTNVSFIVPGSLCLYRTSVIKHIDIAAPGLVIEDFNMTFELHKKKLGQIAYRPDIFGIHQDPYNLHDYIKQIKRWNLGFWQTLKRHGIWPSLFCLATYSFVFELISYAIFVLFVPILVIIFFLNSFAPLNIPLVSQNLSFVDVLVGIFVMDYVITIVATIFERKPIILLYGFFFFFLRFVDSLVYLYTIPLAFRVKSTGVWASPIRK